MIVMERHEYNSPLEDDISASLTLIAETMFGAYGVRGVAITAQKGEETYCSPTSEGGIKINIDPDQIAGGQELPPDIIKAAIGHELGHAVFMLENPTDTRQTYSQTDHFFRNLTEDTAIDYRLRHFPALDQPVVELYERVMPEIIDDLRSTPLSNQLLYSIRIGQVLGAQPQVDARVQEMIDTLRQWSVADGKTFDVIDIMSQPSTNLAELRQIANTFIRPFYDALVTQDVEDGRQDEIQQSIEQYEQSHGAHGTDNQTEPEGADKDAEGSADSSSADTEDAADGTPNKADEGSENTPTSLPGQIAEAVKQAATITEETPNNSKEACTPSDKEELSTTDNDIAEAAGYICQEMNLSQSDAAGYIRLALEHRATIRGVAEVFLQLASQTKGLQRMTQVRGRSSEGAMLHTDAISDLTLQEAHGTPADAIWQAVDRRTTRQTMEFSGLDIHLLVDVSKSMTGTSADHATAAAVCLQEGLRLTKAEVAKQNSHQLPDVRTHIIAFGSNAVELSPLKHQASPTELGRMYKALRYPDARSTHISEALAMSQITPPERDNITLIISDGRFSDDGQARQIATQAPANQSIGQFVIGNSGSKLTENYHELNDPRTLPIALLSLLKDHIRKYS